MKNSLRQLLLLLLCSLTGSLHLSARAESPNPMTQGYLDVTLFTGILNNTPDFGMNTYPEKTESSACELPPVITCPANISVPATSGLCSAVVTYTIPVGTDDCPGAVTTQILGLTPGSGFPVGATTNTFQVVDANSNTATCSFTVTVYDNQSPSIVCPMNISVTETSGACTSTVIFTSPTGTDNCTVATTVQTAGLSSGSAFPVGITTNIFRVTDNSANTSTCSFTVTVLETQVPTIICPADLSVNATNGQCNAIVSFTAPVGSDNCSSVSISQITGSASGSVFPVGSTLITYRATDGSGNTADCNFQVIVADNQNPTITCPANISSNAMFGQCSATISYTVPVGSDNCSGVVVSQTNGLTPGSSFPVGATTNTFQVVDANSNTASCSFTVTVQDNQKPFIFCPSNISVTASTGLCSAIVTYSTPLGLDNCPGASTTQIGGFPSGASFPVGTTTNRFRVTDASGNIAKCAFQVTVTDNEKPVIICPPLLTVSAATGQCTANVSYATPIGTDNCSGVVITQIAGLPSGSSFPVGTTFNRFKATDASGNNAKCIFKVVVTDVETPMIVCSLTITETADAGQCNTSVVYTAPVGTDNCSGVTTTRITGPASGDIFPVGSTLVTYRATDASGNSATCAFNVNVNDVEDPGITCPANISVFENPGTGLATVSFTTPAGFDNCSGYSVTQITGLAPGSDFPLGITTNTFQVTDANLNTATCSFTVNVSEMSALYDPAVGNSALSILPSIYPNPAHDAVTIDRGTTKNTAQLYLYHMNGVLVRQDILVNQVHQLDLSNLPGGMYQLIIRENEMTRRFSLLKE